MKDSHFMVNSDLRLPQSGQNDAGRLRSCLIVGVNNPEEFLAALESEASALFLDLGSSRDECERSRARAAARELLRSRPRIGPRIYIRVAPAESATVDRDLAELTPIAPDGVLLEETRDGASVQHLSAKLAVHEAEAGRPDKGTKILALAQTPGVFLSLSSFAGVSQRLEGLVFDEEGLRVGLAGRTSSPCVVTPEVATPPLPPLAVARSLLTLGAAAAGIAAIDCAYKDLADEAGLAARCHHARCEGFCGKVALSRSQLAAINLALRGDSPRLKRD
jgi:citrate lyase subunit beta/citryl-CoA lyase